MDPINPIAGNPEALNQMPSQQNSQKDPHGITIAAMAVFVLLSLGAVAFLYYQNQQLKNLLSGYQTVTSQTPSPTPDVTATWQTYTNTAGGYSYKVPPEWKSATSSAKVSQSLFGPSASKVSGLGGVEVTKSSNTVDQYVANLLSQGVFSAISQNNTVINGLNGVELNYKGSATSGWSFYVSNGVNIYNIYINSLQAPDVANFNLLLSTFQFVTPTLASPSPSPIPIPTTESSPSASPM